MGLGDVIVGAFKDYKKNFNITWRAFFLFALVPLLVSNIFLIATGLYRVASPEELFFNNGLFVTIIVLFYFVLYLFLNFWISVTLYYAAVKNKGKMDFSAASSSGLRYFWKFFLVSIIFISIMVIPSLFLAFGVEFGITLLIILSIIGFLLALWLILYWVLSFFILVEKNAGVFESLKKSMSIIKGKWWKTFGYVIVSYLIMVCFYFGAGIILIPFNLAVHYISTSLGLFILGLFAAIIHLVAQAVAVPFLIFFLKNYYNQEKSKK